MNKKNDGALLWLGVIFIFIPYLSFFGIMLLLIYFFKKNKSEIFEDLEKEIKKGNIEVDEDDYEVKEVVPEQIEVSSDVKHEKVEDYNYDVTDKNSIDWSQKSYDDKNDGPIKYYK